MSPHEGTSWQLHSSRGACPISCGGFYFCVCVSVFFKSAIASLVGLNLPHSLSQGRTRSAAQALWGKRVRRNAWRWLGAPCLSEFGDQKVTWGQKRVRCLKRSAGRHRPRHFSTAFLSHHAGPRDAMTGRHRPPASGVGSWQCEEKRRRGGTGRGLCGSATN